MIVARTIEDLRLDHASPIGFVPTMGAFHEGHLTLMRRAKASYGSCVVSLFVNPTQFGPREDFANYPRHEERDFELAASAGVDVMFAPSTEDMASETSTRVTVPGVSTRWEGEHRPGHFDGVATVVAKLFHIVRPSDAFFGLKDFQQCAVIRQMVHDLRFPIALHFEETVREMDGLAMSSRNAYLTPDERQAAPLLYRTISEASRQIVDGRPVDESTNDAINALSRGGFSTQYLALVDAETLEPLDALTGASRIIVAAMLGRTRLIDNVAVVPSVAR